MAKTLKPFEIAVTHNTWRKSLILLPDTASGMVLLSMTQIPSPVRLPPTRKARAEASVATLILGKCPSDFLKALQTSLNSESPEFLSRGMLPNYPINAEFWAASYFIERLVPDYTMLAFHLLEAQTFQAYGFVITLYQEHLRTWKAWLAAMAAFYDEGKAFPEVSYELRKKSFRRKLS
jgi:hypothetical protein